MFYSVFLFPVKIVHIHIGSARRLADKSKSETETETAENCGKLRLGSLLLPATITKRETKQKLMERSGRGTGRNRGAC